MVWAFAILPFVLVVYKCSMLTYTKWLITTATVSFHATQARRLSMYSDFTWSFLFCIQSKAMKNSEWQMQWQAGSAIITLAVVITKTSTKCKSITVLLHVGQCYIVGVVDKTDLYWLMPRRRVTCTCSSRVYMGPEICHDSSCRWRCLAITWHCADNKVDNNFQAFLRFFTIDFEFASLIFNSRLWQYFPTFSLTGNTIKYVFEKQMTPLKWSATPHVM